MKNILSTFLLALLLPATTASAQSVAPAIQQSVNVLGMLPKDLQELPPATVRSGQDIYDNFRAGLAAPSCDLAATQPRWQAHFAHVTKQMSTNDRDLLALFGYVVDNLREAGLPTEFALIPFVESGYQPNAHSSSGPTGMWQFIATTARNHQIHVSKHYDGRLSPADSTQAAVSYLSRLDEMFNGNWELMAMAYNAGEYRILGAMRKAGVTPETAVAAELPGLSWISYAYVEKLHAIACLLETAPEHEQWFASLNQPIPVLTAQTVPSHPATLAFLAEQQQWDSNQITLLNPALRQPLSSQAPQSLHVLLPASIQPPTLAQLPEVRRTTPAATRVAATTQARPATKTHTVRRGESAWSIAKRHGLTVQRLLSYNQLTSSSVLLPGMVLKLKG